MSEYTEYLAKKTSGLAELVKINDSFVISSKRFSPETGEVVTPEVKALGREELVKDKQALLAEIADIDSMLAEMDKLTQVVVTEKTA